MARHRPGADRDRAEHGQQRAVGPPALALDDRPDQDQRRREHAEPDQVGRTVLAGQHLAHVVATEVEQAPAGGVRDLQVELEHRGQADHPGADPDRPDRAAAVQPLRPQERQDQHRADEQQQAHVADPAHDREGAETTGSTTTESRCPAAGSR